MKRIFLKIFKVYPDELKLLLWIIVIQFAMRISSVLINNYAQTAFLKRYGVEYLPTIFLINSILVFFIINFLGVLMDRYRATRVFTGILLFFAVSVGAIWLLLPLNISLLYPVLFILKTEAGTTLPLLYWNIMNSIFTSRQAKRLFTLITAGGILGSTLGNLLTGQVADWVGIDNVMLIFIGGMCLAAIMNERIEWVLGAPIQTRTDRRKKRDTSLKETLSDVLEYGKRSPFLKFMIVIIALPNMVLPILLYQFNYVVDITYAAEEATIEFFGMFRGISNAIIFFLLMVSGRLLSRWGVATGLLLHPVNYFLAFAGLFFRFDIFSGIYARFSTEALKTTINNPARAVLYNFFPSDVRGKIQVFLRGTVVKAAGMCGAGLLLLSKGLLEPEMLSMVAAPLILAWILSSVLIKRRYASMLIQVLMDKQIDWRTLETANLKQLTQDKRTLEILQRGLKEQDPEIAVLCAEILSQLAPDAWASWVVGALPGKPPHVQKRLLDELKAEDSEEAVHKLLSMTEDAPADTLVHLIPTLSRLDPQGNISKIRALTTHSDSRVQVEALAALYRSGDPQAQRTCRQRVKELFREEEPRGIQAALEILAKTGDKTFSQTLLQWAKKKDPHLSAPALVALSKMNVPESLAIAEASIQDPSPHVRRAAAQVILASSDEQTSAAKWVPLLGDEDSQVREMAFAAIRRRGERAAGELIPALASPSPSLRNQVLSLLDEFDSPPTELSQFISRQLQGAYQNLVYVKSLQKLDHPSAAVSLLTDHLLEKNEETLETVLRVMAVQEFGDRIDVIRRALQTGSKRDVDNAVEALETSLHSDIRKTLIPLLEESPLEEKLDVGRHAFSLPSNGVPSAGETLMALLDMEDPVTVSLALYALEEGIDESRLENVLTRLAGTGDPRVKEALYQASQRLELLTPLEKPSSGDLSLLEKLLHIRKIPIFAELRIGEQLAIANIARESMCSQDGLVVREGDHGDVLYLVLHGDLSVVKGLGSEQEMRLDRIKDDGFFGEMALFDSQPRSASVVSDSQTQLLVLEGTTFKHLMENHPAIPVRICRILSQRMRYLHRRLQGSFSKSE